jgi:hypothetical protein
LLNYYGKTAILFNFSGVTARVSPFAAIFFALPKMRSKKGFPLQSLTQFAIQIKINLTAAFVNAL